MDWGLFIHLSLLCIHSVPTVRCAWCWASHPVSLGHSGHLADVCWWTQWEKVIQWLSSLRTLGKSAQSGHVTWVSLLGAYDIWPRPFVEWHRPTDPCPMSRAVGRTEQATKGGCHSVSETAQGHLGGGVPIFSGPAPPCLQVSAQMEPPPPNPDCHAH